MNRGSERLTVTEAAREIGVSERSTRRLIERGELPAYRPTPHKVFVFASDLDAFIESRRTGHGCNSHGTIVGKR